MFHCTLRRVLVLALVLPVLGGCFVTSKNPVLRAGEEGRDLRLRGLWVTDSGREILHIMRPELSDEETVADEAPGFSGLYVVSGGEDPEDRDNWARARMISTKVKDRKVLSMRFTEGSAGTELEDIPGWLIFLYEINEGRLYLHMIDENVVNDAIKSGRLPGQPKSGAYSDPHVTASGPEWVAFLEKADLEKLFDREDDSVLIRVTAAEIRMLAENKAAGSQPAPPATNGRTEPR